MQSKNELERLIQNARNQYNSYTRSISGYNNQIARLEAVYKKLAEIKSDYRRTKKATMEVFDEKGVWAGEKRAYFLYSGNELDIDLEGYYKTLDAAHDAINAKIGALRAEKAKMTPLLGNLLGQIEQWRVEIENMAN